MRRQDCSISINLNQSTNEIPHLRERSILSYSSPREVERRVLRLDSKLV